MHSQMTRSNDDILYNLMQLVICVDHYFKYSPRKKVTLIYHDVSQQQTHVMNRCAGVMNRCIDPCHE